MNDTSKDKGDESRWYYNVEMAPGKITSGLPLKNLHLNRPILAATEVAGQTCLDIGSMEGVIPALMGRRGAARIVSFDRDPHKKRFGEVARAYGFTAERIIKPSVADLVEHLHSEGEPGFDVVTFFGVLYHMYDPLVALKQMRQLTRSGGLMLLETPAVLEDSMAAYFNAGGRLFKEASTYYMNSVPLLEYQLRYCGFEPIDIFYFFSKKCDVTGKQLIRVSVACRATDKPSFDVEDKWVRASFERGPRARDEAVFPRLKQPVISDDVSYTVQHEDLFFDENTGGLNMLKSVASTSQVSMDERNLTLYLNDSI